MNLVLLNLQSKQQIKLNNNEPLIIGRGNVVGCCDKRVSRNHGKLTCTLDGKIHLIALHSNPCFFTRNGVPPVLQLNKNEEETLNEGDCVGLLPNAFWFQISSDREINIKEESNESKEPTFENIEINLSKETENIVNVDSNNVTSTEAESSEHRENKNVLSSEASTSNSVIPQPSATSTTSSENSNAIRSPEFEKTRRLPLWMYEIDEVKDIKKSPAKRTSSNVKESKNKKAKVSSDTKAEKEPEFKPSETCTIKVEDEEVVLDKPSTSQIPESVEVSDTTSKPEGDASEGESSKQNQHKEGYESNVENEPSVSAPKRPICQYEGRCYRKNPQHKLDYSHPGDPDFVPYEDRPLCQYGAACYRRNESHRIEYRHPPPGSDTQAVSSSSSASLGEERPPCLKGSSCYRYSPRHRKDFYHPPKGYTCHFRRTPSSGGNFSMSNWDSDSSGSFGDLYNWDYFSSDDDFDDYGYDYFGLDEYGFDY